MSTNLPPDPHNRTLSISKGLEANLYAIFENTGDVIYSLDREFRYIIFNTPLKKVLNRVYGVQIQPNEEVFGLKEKLDAHKTDTWESKYSEALSGKTVRFINDYSTPGKPVFLKFIIHPIWENGEISGLSCFGRDITEQRLAELKIKELNESLELKVKERTAALLEANQELETFSYTVSHDLKTPLRTVSGFAKLLLNKYATHLDEEAKELLNAINSSTKKMNKLIQDLLHFSKLGKAAPQIKAVDMNILAGEAINEIRLAKQDFKAQLKLYELGQTSCDPALIKQVWSNLIYNALKYSSKKEHPLVEIGKLEIENEPVYYVKDNGSGFDMKHAGKLFEAFQRLHTDEEFEGTGVGLATARRIIGRHGGRIWADGAENVGACFYFTIPVPQ